MQNKTCNIISKGARTHAPSSNAVLATVTSPSASLSNSYTALSLSLSISRYGLHYANRFGRRKRIRPMQTTETCMVRFTTTTRATALMRNTEEPLSLRLLD